MNFFKKKEKTKCCLIKEVELTKSGYNTYYYTTINERFVTNSLFKSKDEAESFFERVLNNNGKTLNKKEVRVETI
jgi:type IV secretory pathway ATPase VirB11/archaellum biosynthesis ATPase